MLPVWPVEVERVHRAERAFSRHCSVERRAGGVGGAEGAGVASDGLIVPQEGSQGQGWVLAKPGKAWINLVSLHAWRISWGEP